MSRKLIIILIAIISLALIINLVYLFDRKGSENAGNQSYAQNEIASNNSINQNIQVNNAPEADEGAEEEESSENLQGTMENVSGCILKYNLIAKTVIFYNANELHSNNMKPIVRELEKNYPFYWKNTTYDSEFNTCLGYYQATTPTFICAGTKQQIVGETSKSALEAFAKACS